MQRLHENYLREVGAAWYDPLPFLAAIATPEGERHCAAYLRGVIDRKLTVFGYRDGLRSWWMRRRLRHGVPWGWKEPRTTLFAPCWLTEMPGAKFLHIVRNPLAVAGSIQKRELEFQAKGDRPSGRIQEFNYCVELAMNYVEAGEAVGRRTPDYHRIRFEDIQLNPVGALGELAAFCDIPFNNDIMARAAATIRPTRPDTVQRMAGKSGLLARYPLAAKLGYS